jgi:hypothetical protein
MDIANVVAAATATLSGETFWFSDVDYRVLFEHRFVDEDDAGGLIAVIPVDVGDPPDREHLVVRDSMRRWDVAGAETLRVAAGDGLTQAGAVEVLSTLPAGWSGAPVVVEVRTAGAVRRQVYPTVRAFSDAASAATTDPLVTLGGIQFRAGRLDLADVLPPAPVLLTRPGDAVTVSCAAPALADGAVLYLRLRS